MQEKMHQWASGFQGRPRGVTADKAAEELQRIRNRRGELTAKSVVDESRPEDAPLHSAFEWNDSVAGERYREQQARSLIRAVITIETPEVPQHRTFVLVKPARDEEASASYQPTILVVKDRDLLRDGLRRLQSEVDAAQSSVGELLRLAETVEEAAPHRQRLGTAREGLAQASAAVAEIVT